VPASQSERRRALERRITNTARERGTTAARLRRLVGFAVLCETLSEAVARGIIPLFFVKGGVAVELRLGLLARATRDLDIGLCAPPTELLQLFDSALEVGFGDFRLRRRGEVRALDNGALALEVAVAYIGRPWATVDVDLAPATLDWETDSVPPVALSEVASNRHAPYRASRSRRRLRRRSTPLRSRTLVAARILAPATCSTCCSSYSASGSTSQQYRLPVNASLPNERAIRGRSLRLPFHPPGMEFWPSLLGRRVTTRTTP
jgi:Nucleotidyl transferase AbiEii toxin, Type IV TA system